MAKYTVSDHYLKETFRNKDDVIAHLAFICAKFGVAVRVVYPDGFEIEYTGSDGEVAVE